MTRFINITDTYQNIPIVNPQELEAILDLLPSDYHVGMTVDRGFRKVDYSALEKQIRKDNPCVEGVNLSSPSYVHFDFNAKQIPKEKLLELYAAQYDWRKTISDRKIDLFMAERDKLRLEISVDWYWRDGPGNDDAWYRKIGEDALDIKIGLDIGGVCVEYPEGRPEPKIVSKLREALHDNPPYDYDKNWPRIWVKQYNNIIDDL